MKNQLIFIILAALSAYYFFSRPEPSTPEVSQQKIIETKEITEKPKKQKEIVVKSKKVLNLQPRQSTSANAKYPNLGDDFVPFDDEGNRYVTQIIQTGRHLVYHGDVLIGDAKDIKKIQAKGSIKVAKPQKWIDGNVPFLIDQDLMNYEKILEAIEYFNETTNVKFVPYTDQPNYIHITLGDSDCYSYVGMMGGKQEIFLTPQCGVKEIVHELTHTVGFFHEQNREDRDEFIEVLWENIDESHHTQFKKIPNDFLGVTSRPFDLDSLMMYSSYTFSAVSGEPALITKSGNLIERTHSLLSDEDINRINLAYPGY